MIILPVCYTEVEMSHAAVVTFTARNQQWVLDDEGSQAWRLNAGRAREAEYLVCTQNCHNSYGFGDPTAPHGAAFLVGRISDVVPSPERPDRWLIKISEYATCNIPDVWGKNGQLRYPVWYTTIEELGIDLSTLSFRPLPPSGGGATMPQDAPEAPPTGGALTIAEAKRGLALTLGVPEEAIEITIRA